MALFKWSPSVTEAQRQRIHEALCRLPDHIPELRAYRIGPDAGLVEGNWEYAVVADFDDEEGWRTYTDHPEHQRVIADVIKPALAARAAVQYEF